MKVRLEGNFPGGDVDLQYRFTVVDGFIANLTLVGATTPNL